MACPFAGNNRGAIPGQFRQSGSFGRNTRAAARARSGSCANTCTAATTAATAAATAAAARNAQCVTEAENCCTCRHCGRSIAASNAQNRVVRTCANAVGDQLYNGCADEQAVVLTTCCDACGCREFRLDRRNPFWPTFARPRWLSCDALYSRRR